MNDRKPMTDIKSNGIYYGWVIVVICTLTLLVSNGLSIGGIPVFYKFIQTDLVNSLLRKTESSLYTGWLRH